MAGEGPGSDYLQTAAVMTAAAFCLSVWITPIILNNAAINSLSRGIRVAIASALCIWNLYCFVELLSFVQKPREGWLGISCRSYLMMYLFLTIAVARGYTRDDPMAPFVKLFGESMLIQTLSYLCWIPVGIAGIALALFPGIVFSDLVGYGGCDLLEMPFGAEEQGAHLYVVTLVGAGVSHALAAAACKVLAWYSDVTKNEL